MYTYFYECYTNSGMIIQVLYKFRQQIIWMKCAQYNGEQWSRPQMFHKHKQTTITELPAHSDHKIKWHDSNKQLN